VSLRNATGNARKYFGDNSHALAAHLREENPGRIAIRYWKNQEMVI